MTARRIHIVQGQYAVRRDDPECCLTTLLGSCISVCLLDPSVRAGGMNHFLLARDRTGSLDPASYGVNAMELLINALLKIGAKRHRLRAHVFGGARMLAGLSDIGQLNIEFATGFLRGEGIAVLSQSTGGTQARRVNFWPCNGHLSEELVPQSVLDIQTPRAASGSVELF